MLILAKCKITPVQEFKNQDFVSATFDTRKLFTYLCPARFTRPAARPVECFFSIELGRSLFNWDSTPLLWTLLRCPERPMRISGNELFHAPYNAAFQTNLDSMWMCVGFRENILDDAFRKFSGSLILFLHNRNTRSRFDIRPDDSVHLYRL